MDMRNTKQVQTSLNLRYEPDAFVSLANALSFAHGCHKPHRVMLGDDGRFWVVCPADADVLDRAGYEFAE